MKIKQILSVILLFFLLSSFSIDKKEFTSKLVSIEYFSKCKCSPKSPILVRVTFKIQNSNISMLKMKHTFENGITMTVPVESIDKKGNVIYDFCISKNGTKKFTTVFITGKGEVSNKISITANAKKGNIVQGTAPKVIWVN